MTFSPARLLARFVTVCFKRRNWLMVALLGLTVLMGCLGWRLRMEAGFEKQMPTNHPYVETFHTYRDDVMGANRLNIVVRARTGTIWSAAGLKRLYAVTQAVTFLPNVERLGVQSLWTPNTFVNEITEEGFRADPLIDGSITPDRLDAAAIAGIQAAAVQGGFVGTLVSRGQDSAMISAELLETDKDGHKLDYVAYNAILEQLRQRFEDQNFSIEIIGFAKQVGEIADSAKSVLRFFGLALLLTAGAVYWYCRSVRFTLLPIVCSLSSLVWQFGALHLLGFGLDPLAVLVPFLVFAIGVSHGVQQINYIVREVSLGKSCMDACRASFSGLLIPGTLALATALVSFVTLLMIPIPMVRELAIAASLGVGFKIITNLVMLPVAASYCRIDQSYADAAMVLREKRAGWLRVLARVAKPRNAAICLAVVGALFSLAVWQSQGRVVGTVEPGAPELRPDARFNRDAVSIASNYDTGLDWLTVIFEAKVIAGAAGGGSAPTDGQGVGFCGNSNIGLFQDRFTWAMQPVPGVLSIASFSDQMKQYNRGYNEGNPKMEAIPLDSANFAALATEIARTRGTMRKDCSMTAVHLYLTDHKAVSINRVIAAVEAFAASQSAPGISIRLASGNAGVLAAVNQTLERSELPMMLWVYAAIVLLVLVTYRDLRAVLACCLPLTVGTFIGYWFMKELNIGLTVATLPVMVLAVGIGVDYAFYIYNRLQMHLANGLPIVKAVEQAILEVGTATIFTAVTLAVGVATWSFSALKFQADMGKLLAFMFMVNMIMAMTALPAFAVWLERLFPRKTPARAPGLLQH
ncbi:efflux RND transporter permease subunit [Duganella violaceipulchra]|uniref:MMPL family transporter n=1 Tax=Duganella violaceipulchra TaxID=2849652 RepID=A0AA41H303_9BURK|nr:MMPL family transporter [Duganella violaceicalia]MBV6319488.1 MMPL family transporter [Duganella violaceicalia]MCP2006701.1 putative RND superfamily exporter protein [Duganella violaceicalia]